MEDADLALALALQEELNNESPQTPIISNHHNSSSKSKTFKSPSLVDEFWELTDPNPDIRALFLQFNERFFWGRLAGIEVKWSPRMTVCAGICCYEGRGGLCSVRLSTPLLKLRPRKDLVETLLHEMIHAYLFVTDNNKDHDGHGPEFHKHMYRINAETGTNISVYHTFHDEVAVYKTHWWKCDGPCQQRKPYFGYVKRSMNRAPSANDFWWGEHQRTCGGTYTKIKEPEGYGQKKKGGKKAENESKSDSEKGKVKSPDIRTFWGNVNSSDNKKPATVTSGSISEIDKVIQNGVLVRKNPESGKNVNDKNSSKSSTSTSNTNPNNNINIPVRNSSVTNNKTNIPKTNSSNSGKPMPRVNGELSSKGDNSVQTIGVDATNVPPYIPKKDSNYDSNVMQVKTIWNKEREPVISRPTFTGKGETLGGPNQGHGTTNQPLVTPKNNTNPDLNVMHAKTIWNKDREQVISRPTFTGKGETIGGQNQAHGGLSWLAQLRKDIGKPGQRKNMDSSMQRDNSKHKAQNTNYSNQPHFHSGKDLSIPQANAQQDQPVHNKDIDILNRRKSTPKLSNILNNGDAKRKIKKAVLHLSDSDDGEQLPPNKRLKRSNSPDNLVSPVIKSRRSKDGLTSPPSHQRQNISDFFSQTSSQIPESSSSSNSVSSDNHVSSDVPMALCPVCQVTVKTVEINAHLDSCLLSCDN
ncbi:DNA-dependent metalloprotease SPRTN [Patella vulgata]|uniref:DNA-dependent metalloprotease SPRTN n=1 Tax=Patella vulgata TaxID=6465 RepID=UPI0021800A1F|nr:DNA-dependent metalloprotease SPRTN [Patella vulgata]